MPLLDFLHLNDFLVEKLLGSCPSNTVGSCPSNTVGLTDGPELKEVNCLSPGLVQVHESIELKDPFLSTYMSYC